MNDIVEQTDWSRWPQAELLNEIEKHADILRGATLYDLDWIMSPAKELAARVDALAAEVALLRDAITAQDERDLAASVRVGEIPFGCDTSDHLADVIMDLRARADELAAEVERLTAQLAAATNVDAELARRGEWVTRPAPPQE